MKALRFLVGSSVVFAACAGFLAACGGDDGVDLAVGDDSGTDAKTGTDAAKADANVADVNSPNDVNQPDTGVDSGGDAGGDAGDAGDAGVEDSGFFDAATYDAGSDAGFTPDSGTAAVQLADVFCNTVARCCFGDANLKQGDPITGGGTYNRNKCLQNFEGNGFEQSSRGSAVNPAHVIVDQTGSKTCADKLTAMTCNLGFAEFDSIRTACYGALKGTQGPAQSCTVSAECQDGLFCNNPTNAADAGKCEAVRATGANCGDTGASTNDSQHVCSYRYSGHPTRYCEWFDFTNVKALPKDQWKCKDSLANGGFCASSPWCASGICNFDTAVCEATTTYFTPSDCSQYKNP